MTTPPRFFCPADLRLFQQRLRTNPRYNNQVADDAHLASQLKAAIFAPTTYWVQQVAAHLPFPTHHTVRQQWEQGHYLRRYSWGRIGLEQYPDKGFYITLGVDSGETDRAQALVKQNLVLPGPALIMKVDVHTARDSSLSLMERQAGRAAIDKLPLATRWHRIEPSLLSMYSWPRLIRESVDFITQHEPVLCQLWEGKPVRLPYAHLSPGREEPLKQGRIAIDIAQREMEAGDEHRRLSNLLQKLLPAYGYSGISHSCPLAYNSGKFRNEVDMVATDAQGQLTFFELKALPSLDKCLREAIGQLLEYAYWEAPTPSQARRLVVATSHPLTPPASRYLQRLKTEWRLPLSYVQVDTESHQLHFFTP